MTRRQTEISECLHGFIDRAYWPDYEPTAEDWVTFFHVETHGRLDVGTEDLERIKPLLEAKGDYDLQIKSVYEEVSEWWAKGWGWDAPLHAVISEASGVYLQALEKIKSAFTADPVSAISNFTGFSQVEKNNYLKQRS